MGDIHYGSVSETKRILRVLKEQSQLLRLKAWKIQHDEQHGEGDML